MALKNTTLVCGLKLTVSGINIKEKPLTECYN